MPDTAQEMARQLGLGLDFSQAPLKSPIVWGGGDPGATVVKGKALFPRVDAVATPSPAKPQPEATPPPPKEEDNRISIQDFQKVELKVAKVLSAERVPKSNKLLKLQVDLGGEQRQIVAGIGKKYGPDDVVGKTIVVVANLKPAKLMGVESQGMVLAAGDQEVQGLVTFEDVDLQPGTKVK